MRRTKKLYWVFTILFAVFMTMSAIPDVMLHPVAVQGMNGDLGYPLYFVPFIGIAKLLGVIAILIPAKYPTIKEWAYAGLFFDLLGATYSVIAAGQPVQAWAFMILPLALAILSYRFYRKISRGVSKNEAQQELTTGLEFANV